MTAAKVRKTLTLDPEIVEAFGGDPAPGIVKSCHYDPK